MSGAREARGRQAEAINRCKPAARSNELQQLIEEAGSAVNLDAFAHRVAEEFEAKGNQTHEILPVNRGNLPQRDEKNNVDWSK